MQNQSETVNQIIDGNTSVAVQKAQGEQQTRNHIHKSISA
jgi:hypothetical protein